jgi:16S rRNA (cytosine1402-N4)-methyltransferase
VETEPSGPDERFDHRPVLLTEVLSYLEPRPGGLYVDATLGGGGHAEAVLEASAPDGRLIGIDRDPMALRAAGRRLARFGERVRLVHGRFSQLSALLAELGAGPVDGVLADLGVSSPQLDRAERGFSFSQEGPLDMRMDPSAPLTAADLVNQAPLEELIRIFRDYGEERHAPRLARAIDHDRRTKPFTTTRQLASLIERVMPRSGGRDRIHPATRVFQALRIAVNDELGELETGLEAAFSVLKPGGRMVIISFHSLEDRRVKQFFRDRAADCVCPPELPICRCSKVSEMRILTRKPVEAGPGEAAANPRARSARLRAAEKTGADSADQKTILRGERRPV